MEPKSLNTLRHTFILLFIFCLLPVSLLMAEKKKPHIVFLITEDPLNYEAHNTIPVFAEKLRSEYGYEVSVLLGNGPHGACQYPDIGKVTTADLLVVFSRRIALPTMQMNVIKDYLKKGKPLIGIRTANHAFTCREKIEAGYEDWPAFVADIIGCENRGYGPEGIGIDVTIPKEATTHPVLKGVSAANWRSEGNIYKVAPLLDTQARVLLTGSSSGLTEPIAWTRKAGKSKVFYTSLGYPTDFNNTAFQTLMVNAIRWALDKKAGV